MIINENTIAITPSNSKEVVLFNIRDLAELITYKNERSSKTIYSVSYIDWGSWKTDESIPTKEVDITKKEYDELKAYLDNSEQVVSTTPITIHKLSYCINRNQPDKIEVKDITND